MSRRPRALIPCPSAAAYARGCRCAGCREARTKRSRWIRGYKTEVREAGEMPADKHGVVGFDEWGCRCWVCRKARRSRRDNKGARDMSFRPNPEPGDCDKCAAEGVTVQTTRAAPPVLLVDKTLCRFCADSPPVYDPERSPQLYMHSLIAEMAFRLGRR